ncbi:unnamed protein product [Meloidogyne enterolobii]|uniref:Uncharacterized protein n=1 Tax=Meloidogyne enterolobii TaxID=390850 RepID=A0ACB0YL36_MELEN
MGYGEHGIWRRAIGILPPLILFNETGTDIQPNLPAAFLYIEEQTDMPQHTNIISSKDLHDASTLELSDTTKAFRMLASDPIKCPGSTNIILQFRIWSTKGIKLNLCLFERHSMQQIEGKCQQVPVGTSPAIVQQQFQTPPQNTEFMFVFQVQSVNKDFDNFVLLDDIEMVTDHSSAYCGQLGADIAAHKGWLSDGGMFTAQMLNTLLNRPIHSAKDLTCDFSKRALNCQWANLEKLNDGMSQWEIGILSSAKNTKTSEDILIPVGDVALARLDSHNKSAILLSERILCTLPSITNTNGNSGTLSFRSWGSGNGIKLNVCIIRADSLEVLDCQNVGGNDGERKLTEEGDEILVEVPRLDEPIRLALRAETIDVCRLLKCDFERDGSMCLYTSSRVAASVSMFRAYNNSAFTVLFTRSKVAILESPIFHLNTPARLHFDYFVSKGPAKLHFCQDSVMRDLSSCFIISADGETFGWKHDFIEVLPTDRKLYLIARLDGKGRANVQIDNLELTDIMDHSIC